MRTFFRKPVVYVEFGLIIAFFCIAIALSNRADSMPGAVRSQQSGHAICPQPEHDFGSVSPAEAERLIHRFTLTNSSDSPLQIIDTLTSCDCTAINHNSQTPIQPGASRDVTVQVDWADRLGHQQSQIIIVTDRNKDSHIVLTVRGTIKIPGMLNPSKLAFGVIRSGNVATLRAKLSNVSRSRPIQLHQITNPLSDILQITKLGEDDALLGLYSDPAIFEFQMTSKGPHRRVADWITFVAEPDMGIERRVFVSAIIEGGLEAEPSSLFFSVCPGESHVRRVIAVRKIDKSDSLDASVDWDSEGHSPFSIESTTHDTSRVERLHVVFSDRSDLKRVVRSTLRIESKQESIDIPIVVLKSNCVPDTRNE